MEKLILLNKELTAIGYLALLVGREFAQRSTARLAPGCQLVPVRIPASDGEKNIHRRIAVSGQEMPLAGS